MEIEGAIELPAEANPLTEGLLYQTLRNASSNNQNQIQTGTKQLQKWETQPGYHNLLQTVFVDRSLPVEVRYLAIIQLKNGIDRYWRKSASNAIGRDEKAAIRPRLLESGINEADSRLALQNALVTAKIIRLDYPTDWPEVIPQLLSLLRSAYSSSTGSRWHLPRALLILLQIVKELSTGRLLSTRAKLQKVAPDMIGTLSDLYMSRIAQWQMFLRNGGDDEGGAMDDIENSLLALRIIRRLLISGYDFPMRQTEVRDIWEFLSQQLPQMLDIHTRGGGSLSGDVQRNIEKHVLQIGKLHNAMAQTHPTGFALAPNSVDLVRGYWGIIANYSSSYAATDGGAIAKDTEEAPLAQRLSLRGLLILRTCIKMVFNPAQTFRYRHAQEKDEHLQAITIIKEQLLDQKLVSEMMETLVTRYFIIRNEDMSEIHSDPEEWDLKCIEGSEAYESSLRACAERLFMDLSIHFKDWTLKWLVEVIKTYLGEFDCPDI